MPKQLPAVEIPPLPIGPGTTSGVLFGDHNVDLKFTELETAVTTAMEQAVKDDLSGSEISASVLAAVLVVVARDIVSRTLRWIKSHWS